MAEINWSKISKSIAIGCKNAYVEQNVAISDEEIADNINIFYNIINTRFGYARLDGIGRELLPALQNSFCDNVGSLGDLRTLKTLVDSFLKLMLIISGRNRYADIENKGTKELFMLTGIVPTYIGQQPRVTETVVEGYRGRADGLYLFAYADYCRNEVHESPDMDVSQVAYQVKYVMAFYIFVVQGLKTSIIELKPELKENHFAQIKSERGELMYYDLMNYGQVANALKNRIINSFVFDQLYQGAIPKESLIDKMIRFSKSSLGKMSASRFIDRLISNNRLLEDASHIVTLTDKERERLSMAYADYAERIHNFQKELALIIADFGLTCNEEELLLVIKSFFEHNFNADLLEIDNDLDIEGVADFDTLLSKFELFGCSVDKTKAVLISILQLCKSNDILVRLGIGKLFSKISNPDSFETYAKNENRVVYVDTQIVLYALCVNLASCDSEMLRYKSVKNLITAVDTTESAVLVFAKHYVPEVSFHLRQALMLIPFVDRYNHIKAKISNNVFYQFYYEMREKDCLEEGIDSFSEFLLASFGLEESDAYSPSYWTIANDIVEEIIQDELEFTIESFPIFGEEQIRQSSDMFVTSDSKMKSGYILKNDAIMGLKLFSYSTEEREPFFLTWDSAFVQYRRKYIERYKRTKKVYWHLFSPSKFVNHLDLLNFKVDVDSLSDDLLSMIEADEYKTKTAHVIDRFNRFLEIPEIDGLTRRKYIKLLYGEIYDEENFPNHVESENPDSSNELTRVANLLDKVLDYYREENDMKEYKSHIANEDYFKGLISLVVKKSMEVPTEDTFPSLIEQLKSLCNEIFQNKESVEC